MCWCWHAITLHDKAGAQKILFHLYLLSMGTFLSWISFLFFDNCRLVFTILLLVSIAVCSDLYLCHQIVISDPVLSIKYLRWGHWLFSSCTIRPTWTCTVFSFVVINLPHATLQIRFSELWLERVSAPSQRKKCRGNSEVCEMCSPYFVTPNILSCRPNSEESGAQFRNLGGHYAHHSTFYWLSPRYTYNEFEFVLRRRIDEIGNRMFLTYDSTHI